MRCSYTSWLPVLLKLSDSFLIMSNLSVVAISILLKQSPNSVYSVIFSRKIYIYKMYCIAEKYNRFFLNVIRWNLPIAFFFLLYGILYNISPFSLKKQEISFIHTAQPYVQALFKRLQYFFNTFRFFWHDFSWCTFFPGVQSVQLKYCFSLLLTWLSFNSATSPTINDSMNLTLSFPCTLVCK